MAAFGRAVMGLRAADLESSETCARLRKNWIEHGLLLFRGGDCDADFQVRLSRCFGELQVHSVKEILHESQPELIVLRGDPTTAAVMDVNGEEVTGFIPWHSDQIYTANINHGGMLRVVQHPSRGGNTGFIDQIEAYAALPRKIQDRIEGLEVVYAMRPAQGLFHFLPFQHVRQTRRSVFQGDIETRVALGDFPAVAHPLVFAQPETGRKVLNFSPMFADHILGMDQAESTALLFEIARHLTDEARVYDHVWLDGDMLLWDNWRMIHTARGVPLGERREAHRTTIAGDYALGRVI